MLSAAIHVNDAGILLVNGILTVPALQIVAELALVTVTVGFTETVTVWAVPAQLPLVEVGVTVYITFSTLVLLLMIALLKVEVDWEAKLSPEVLELSAAIQL